MYDISGSIAVFKNNRGVLKKTLDSFLNADLKSYLYVLDNSPTDELRSICAQKNVEYVFNDKNLGFGAAHNIAIRNMTGKTKYYLILNPDIYFDSGILEKLFNFMERNTDTGLVMPKVLYPDGALQHLCRLLPTPVDLLLRKLESKILRTGINLISKYELRFADYHKQIDVPYLSGCFMFMRTEVFKSVGIFDERFFIYFEDVDLSRRIHQLYRTVYYPEVVVYHNYERGSNKNMVLLRHLISSGVKYFNKWGWFFDKERKVVNRETLKNIHLILKNCNTLHYTKKIVKFCLLTKLLS